MSDENQMSVVALNERSKHSLEEAVARQRKLAVLREFYHLCSIRARAVLCPAGKPVNKQANKKKIIVEKLI